MLMDGYGNGRSEQSGQLRQLRPGAWHVRKSPDNVREYPMILGLQGPENIGPASTSLRVSRTWLTQDKRPTGKAAYNYKAKVNLDI